MRVYEPRENADDAKARPRGGVWLVEGPDGGGKTLGARVLASLLSGKDAEEERDWYDLRRFVKEKRCALKGVEVYHPVGSGKLVPLHDGGVTLRIPNSLKSVITAEPTRLNAYGMALRDMLEGKGPGVDPLEFFSYDRFFHARDFISPLVDEGVQVIVDRSVPSTLAYQSYEYVRKGLSVEGALAHVTTMMMSGVERAYNGNLLMRDLAERVQGVFVFTAREETLEDRLNRRSGGTTYDDDSALQRHVRRLYAGEDTPRFLEQLDPFLPGVPYVVIDTTGLDKGGLLDENGLRRRVASALDALLQLNQWDAGRSILLQPQDWDLEMPLSWSSGAYAAEGVTRYAPSKRQE